MGQAAPIVIEPLFILAPPRNLTSVVCAMIGCHPQLAALPETNLFAAATVADLERLFAREPRAKDGLLRAIAEYGMGGQTEELIGTARAWLEDRRAASTAEVFRQLIEWASPRGIVEKSPRYVHTPGALARISKAFPQARYLHLARHPRAACESVYALRRSSRADTGRRVDPEITPHRAWLRPHLAILEFLEGIPADRQMFLRGEALLTKPEVYLPQIAEWLGVSTDQAAIAAMQHPERSPFARGGSPSAPTGNDQSFMEQPALRKPRRYSDSLEHPLSWDPGLRFDEILKEYATRFGYWGPPPRRKPAPLIILCPMRSSSSLVCAILGRHPEIYGLPAINLSIADTVAELLAAQRRRPRDLDGLVRALAQVRDGDPTEAAIEASQRWLQARSRWTTKHVYDYLLERIGGKVATDASPRTVLRADYLKRVIAMYPQARFLHVTHHPHSTGQALVANRNRTTSPIDPEEFWRKAHQNALDFAATLRLGQYMRIRSEDLLAEPRVYLPQIAGWLGVSTEALAIEAMVQAAAPRDGSRQSAPGAAPGRRVVEPSLDRGVERAPGEAFSKPTVKLAKMLGYA